MRASSPFALALIAGLCCGAASGQDKGKAATPPNFLVDVSAPLLKAVVSRTVDRTEPFTDEVDDAPVTGTRRILGEVDVEIVPCATHAVLDVILSGSVNGCAVTHRRNVLVFTRAFAPFDVRQRVVIGPRGIDSIPGPSWAKAGITLLDITSHSGERDTSAVDFARLGFAAQWEDLEATVSGKIRREIAWELERELAAPLHSTSKMIGSALGWAKKTGLDLERLEFSGGKEHLRARLRFATSSIVTPPPEPPAGADAIVRVHEAMINEGARAGLGGKTFKLSEIDNLARDLTKGFIEDDRKDPERKKSIEALEKLLAGVSGKPANLTLAKVDPVTVRFTRDGFTIESHIARAELAGETSATRMKATYRIEHGVKGIIAVRQGDIAFSAADPSPDGKKIAAPSPASRLLLSALGEETFKARLVLSDLHLPAESRLAAVRPLRVSTGAGWLTLAWKK